MILRVALDQEIRVELRGLEPLTPTLPVPSWLPLVGI
jgi:hypothetical protein